MEYRIARIEDCYELSRMRWDFKTEGKDISAFMSKDIFLKECCEFLKRGLIEENWTHWTAIDKDTIISHISIQHIKKIPKPNRITDEYGYITNVYTKPEYRGKGIGSELMDKVKAWATEKDLEILTVWPSSQAVKFYERKGFKADNEIMELFIRPDE